MNEPNSSVVEELKELLPDPNNRIRLNDFVHARLDEFHERTSVAHFPVQGGALTNEQFAERVQAYEAASADLQHVVALLARWGDHDKFRTLEAILRRAAEAERASSGLVVWIALAWYPVHLLMYSAGVAAISAGNFDALKSILTTHVLPTNEMRVPLVVASSDHVYRIQGSWKAIPGLERRHTPFSDHLLDITRAPLEKTLLLGPSYETIFDDFELMAALVYAYETSSDWGPIGRFGWKNERSAMLEQLAEAGRKSDWPPLRAGLFGGSTDAFKATHDAFAARLSRLNWW